MNKDFSLLTTVRLESGGCTLLPLHLNRLSCAAEAFNFILDVRGLEQALNLAAAEHGQQPPAKLRVTVARDGSWTLDHPELLIPDSSRLQAMLWPDATTSDDPFLRYKTTHRPVYDPAIRKAKELGFIDAIFHNERGLVTEGAVHSIFVRHGDTWRTPTISAGVLPGVYRGHLLETMPNVREEDFPLDRLFDADEIWLTNAVRYVRTITIASASRSADILAR